MNKNPLKIVLTLLLSLIVSLAIPVSARADSPPITQQADALPPLPIPIISWDWVTNIPSASGFDTAKGSIEIGVLFRTSSGGNSAIENSIKFDYFIHTNWITSVEIQNGPAATVVDSLSLYGGYRLVWHNADVYAEGGIRRTWAENANVSPSFQGIGLFGASWRPTTDGRWMLKTEMRILTPETGSVLNGKAQLEPVAYIQRIF